VNSQDKPGYFDTTNDCWYYVRGIYVTDVLEPGY